MASTKTVWGIDVGQCALKALQLRLREGRLQAVSFDVIEHAKILSQPDADEQQLIRSALGKFLSRSSVRGSTVVVSVPGQASFTRFIKLPPVESRKIPEIVRYEARQQIPFNLEDVIWDYQQMSSPAAGPREVEVGIFAMKKDIVSDYVSDFLAMKIEPDLVQMAPVALYNFLRYDRKDAGGATILLDVGAENTNLVIADGDRVWVRNVPLGGNNFTQALCKVFKLPFSKAENLKRHAAESKHARKVFEAMRPVFGDLLTEIQRSIGYYTSLHRDSRIERVVALGNAFRLAGLRKFLSQSLGLEVERVESFNSLADSEATSAPLFRENVLSFGVAFGLAVQGLGQGAIHTSLLPPAILSSKILRRKRPYFAAAGAALLGAIACFGYSAMKTHGELAGTEGVDSPAVLNQKVNALAKQNGDFEKLFDAQKGDLLAEQKRIGQVETLIEDSSYIYGLLRDVWEALPPDDRYQTWTEKAGFPRETLNHIELLRLSAKYVPDVTQYSQFRRVSGGFGEAGQITVLDMGPPAPPPAPDGAAPAPATPPAAPTPGPAVEQRVGGVLVKIIGITPKRQKDGQDYVNGTLVKALQANERTVRLQTPQGTEILATIPLTQVFRQRPEYVNYAPPEEKSGTTAAAEKPAMKYVDKGNDTWFEAEWVVHLPDWVAPPKPPAPAGGDAAGAAEAAQTP
jgi:type IV pilus assembly protein PilM